MNLGRFVNTPGLQIVCRISAQLWNFLFRAFVRSEQPSQAAHRRAQCVRVQAVLLCNDSAGVCMARPVALVMAMTSSTLLMVFSLFVPQDVTCVPTTGMASARCTAPCTPCGGWWAPAARPRRRLRPRSRSGSGTCPGRCVCAPAPCPAWPTASVPHNGSSRAPGLGPSRESCSCQRRSKQVPSGTLSISGK